jgi:TatD DNase family protein
MIFESHAHYDDDRFDEDRDEVLGRLKEENIDAVINVGSTVANSKKSVEIANQYDFVYASVGVHPHEVPALKDGDLETLITLTAHKKVVAIGEIGLDYYYDNAPKEIQKLWFREQINIAKELELPIIYHSREAVQDTYDIVVNTEAYKLGGVIHCYTGSKEMAERFTDLGLYLGVGGILTYKNARNIVEVVKHISLDHILVETDAPYLSPEPKRGQRNDSRHLKYIVQKIAEIKGITVEEVEKVTYQNAENLFFEAK